MDKEELPVKVGDDVYGPIALDRIIADVKNGKLTKSATFWDGQCCVFVFEKFSSFNLCRKVILYNLYSITIH